MKKFFLGLVTAESGTSSKRFISLMSFALLIAVIIADVWFDKEVNNFVYYTLGGLIIGTSTMTLFQQTPPEDYNNNNNNTDNELK